MKAKSKASALVNAIYVCLVLSILSGTVLFLFQYENLLFNNYRLGYTLIEEHKRILNSCILKGFDEKPQKFSGIRTSGTAAWMHWGFLEVLNISVNSENGIGAIKKSYLVGVSGKENDDSAISLSGDRNLKLMDSVEVWGNLFIANKNIDILGNSTHKGNIKPYSSSNAPFLLKKVSEISDYLENIEVSSSTLGNEYQPFHEHPVKIKVDKEFSGSLNGHYILEADEEILIKSNANLNDAIIKAPKVIFEKGFVGNCQVFATKSIIIEENVKLHYPSLLIGQFANDSTQINIRKNAEVSGGVIAVIPKPGNFKRSIVVENDAVVKGTIFSEGDIDLKGLLLGQLYARRFVTKDENFGNVQINELRNCKIDNRAYPDYLFRVTTPGKIKYVPIKEL